jgi:hypothetical protein
VVDSTASVERFGRRRRDSSEVLWNEPCGLSTHELVDAETAEKLGIGCYIAAEIVVVDHQQLFIVGDGKTHGGYRNPPLKPEHNYRIWFGLIVTVDGVCGSKLSLNLTN